MTGPVRERVAAVLADGRQGSGYLLAPRLVLTAAHVAGQGKDVRVVVPGGEGPTVCDVVWTRQDDDCDAALLFAHRDLLQGSPASEFGRARWGQVASLSPVPHCQAIGFPHVQRDADGRLDSEQLIGTLKPGSSMIGGRYVLDSVHAPPVHSGAAGSPWAGFSGAVLFWADLILGVVRSDPGGGWQHGRIEATPADSFFNDLAFRQAVTLHGGAEPLTTPALIRPPDPDTGFERRYAEYIAARHGTLTIFGVDLSDRSRATWPLDAAYLSLEATAPERGGGEATGFPGVTGLGAPLPAEQALAGHERVLLRGVAGSGKTTLVQWLAVSAAQQGPDRVPFVLPLRTLIRRDALPMPADFLSAVRTPITQPPGWTERVLGDGRGLLLIDGIDEIGERERERVRDWLRDLLIAFPGNRWLVTSRPSAVSDSWLASEGFSEFTLSPMSRKDVGSFIDRWHNAARATCAGEEELERLYVYQASLTEAVRTKQDLAGLATNPLMCGLICALHRDRRGYLPHGRKELYDAALSMLLTRRDREREMEVRLTEEPQVQLLQKLAYWMIRNGQVEMDQSDAVDLIEAALPSMPAVAAVGDAREIFRHLLVRSGMLREPAEGAVDFVHRTFQDYLGAKAAVEERDFDLMARNAHLDQWEDVLRMAVAHARPAERARLLKKLIARGDKVRKHRTRLHLLAMACLEHATELDPAVREEVQARTSALIPPRSIEEAHALAEVGTVVLDLLPGPDGLEDDEAEAVVVTASRIASDAAIPVLARFRDHQDPSVRYQLAWTWFRFDTQLYAKDVLSHIPKEQVYFSVQSSEELRLLGQMSGVTHVQVRGAFSAHELAHSIKAEEVINLRISGNPSIEDLGFLRKSFPRLDSLSIYTCDSITTLTSLEGLQLRGLSIGNLPRLETLDGLEALPSLELLVLDPQVPFHGLACIPKVCPLKVLSLPGETRSLEGLDSWPDLEHLSLFDLPTELSADDFGYIADHPSLNSLGLTTSITNQLYTFGLSLPSIVTTHLSDVETDTPLAHIATCFPALQHVSLNGSLDALPAIDISPFAALPDLQTIRILRAGAVLNADKLPTVRLTVRPRPRP